MSNKRLIATWIETWSGRGSTPGWAVHRAYEWAECRPDGGIGMRVEVVADAARYTKDHPEMIEMVRIYELSTSALMAGSTKREVAP